MKSAPNGYTPTVPSLHRDREIKRHERTKLRFYTERNSLEVVLIEDCLTTFSPALGAGEPQRLKPNSKQSTYRSGKPLRHPKTTATSTFSASCKAACVAGSDGMAEQAAEKAAVRRPAPKGASDFEELTVSLKRYPDTNLSFSAACEAMPYPRPARSKILGHSETGQAPSLQELSLALLAVFFGVCWGGEQDFAIGQVRFQQFDFIGRVR